MKRSRLDLIAQKFNEEWQDYGQSIVFAFAMTAAVMAFGPYLADWVGIRNAQWRVGIPIYLLASLLPFVSFAQPRIAPHLPVRRLATRFAGSVVTLLAIWLFFLATVLVME